jgi:hypothetical protein
VVVNLASVEITIESCGDAVGVGSLGEVKL